MGSSCPLEGPSSEQEICTASPGQMWRRGEEKKKKSTTPPRLAVLSAEILQRIAFSHCGFPVTMGSKKGFFKKSSFFLSSIHGRATSRKQQNEIGLCYLSPHQKDSRTRGGDNPHLAFICLIKRIVQTCKICETEQTSS